MCGLTCLTVSPGLPLPRVTRNLEGRGSDGGGGNLQALLNSLNNQEIGSEHFLWNNSVTEALLHPENPCPFTLSPVSLFHFLVDY